MWWDDLAQKDFDRVRLGRARWPEVCQWRSVWRSYLFDVHSGLRQGCVMAPLLFDVFVDSLARVAMHSIPSGLKVSVGFSNGLVNQGSAPGCSSVL